MPPKAKKEILYRYKNEDKDICLRHRSASCEGFYLCDPSDPEGDLSVENILGDKAFIAFYIMIHFDMIHDFADATQDIVEAILNFLNTSEVQNLIQNFSNDPFFQTVIAIILKLESGGSLTQGKLTGCKFGAYEQQREKLAAIPNINVHFADTQFMAMIHCDGNSPFEMLEVDETGQLVPSLEPFLDCGPTPGKKKKNIIQNSGYIGDDPIYYPALIVGEIQGIGYVYNLIDLEQNLPVDHSPQNWRFGVVKYNIEGETANYIKLGDHIYTNSSNGRDFWKKPLVESKLTGQIEEGGAMVTVNAKVAGVYYDKTSLRLTDNNIVTILSEINNRVDGSGWHKKQSINEQDWVFNLGKSIPNAQGGFYTYSSETTSIYSFIGASQFEDVYRAYKLVFEEQFYPSIELDRYTMIEMSSQLLSTAYDASPIFCYRLAGHEDLACVDQWSEVLKTYLMHFNRAASSNEFKVFIDADGSRFRMAPLMNMLCSVLQERASRVEFIMTPGNYYDAATDSGIRKYFESFHRRTRERRAKSGDKSAWNNITNKKYQKWLINQQCNPRPRDADGSEVPNGIINYKINNTAAWRMFDWTIQYDASQIIPQFDILGDAEINPISQVMGNINQWGNCSSPGSFSIHGLSAKKDAKGKSQTSRDAIHELAHGNFCDLAYKTIGDLTKIMDSVEYARLNEGEAVLYLTLDIISAQIAALLGGNHRNYTVLLEDKSGAIYKSKGGTTKNLSAEGSLIVFNNLDSRLPVSDPDNDDDDAMDESKDEIKENSRKRQRTTSNQKKRKR